MPNNSIDMAFIAALEGGPATLGYVPDPTRSKSGVTIGTGFDLGQQSHLDILPKDLRDLLMPYLGLKGSAAVAYLKGRPLRVSLADAKRIDEAYKVPFIKRLMDAYYTATGRDFADLPAAIQTVIASVAFQYGNLETATPNFWMQVKASDWKAALANLRSFGDAYPTRRGKEADLLATAM